MRPTHEACQRYETTGESISTRRTPGTDTHEDESRAREEKRRQDKRKKESSARKEKQTGRR